MSIFQFSNYREYLRHRLAAGPKKGRGEVTKIAKALGVNSTLVSQVLHGRKNFSSEQAQELAEYLGLNPLESEFFQVMVEMERAGSMKLRRFWKSRLEALTKESLKLERRFDRERVLTDSERAIFYSNWIYSAARLFTSIADGQSIASISAKFQISKQRAAEITKFLCEVGLCREDDRGIFKMGPQRTFLEQGSPFLLRHHANWRIKAIQESENLLGEELMFTSPISISHEDFKILREELVKFIGLASERITNSNPENVACLNLDLFWVKK